VRGAFLNDRTDCFVSAGRSLTEEAVRLFACRQASPEAIEGFVIEALLSTACEKFHMIHCVASICSGLATCAFGTPQYSYPRQQRR
jgi:hypothetical protein